MCYSLQHYGVFVRTSNGKEMNEFVIYDKGYAFVVGVVNENMELREWCIVEYKGDREKAWKRAQVIRHLLNEYV